MRVLKAPLLLRVARQHSWKAPLDAQGMQGLPEDVLSFKTIAELDNGVVIKVQILLERSFFHFIVSNATVYSRESNKIKEKKKQQIDVATDRACGAPKQPHNWRSPYSPAQPTATLTRATWGYSHSDDSQGSHTGQMAIRYIHVY